MRYFQLNWNTIKWVDDWGPDKLKILCYNRFNSKEKEGGNGEKTK